MTILMIDPIDQESPMPTDKIMQSRLGCLYAEKSPIEIWMLMVSPMILQEATSSRIRLGRHGSPSLQKTDHRARAKLESALK